MATARAEPNELPTSQPEKPDGLSKKDADEWLRTFGIEDEPEPFDGYDAMRG